MATEDPSSVKVPHIERLFSADPYIKSVENEVRRRYVYQFDYWLNLLECVRRISCLQWMLSVYIFNTISLSECIESASRHTKLYSPSLSGFIHRLRYNILCLRFIPSWLGGLGIGPALSVSQHPHPAPCLSGRQLHSHSL